MFELYTINEMTMTQTLIGTFERSAAGNLEAVKRAERESEGTRNFVRYVVLAPNGKNAFETRGQK